MTTIQDDKGAPYDDVKEIYLPFPKRKYRKLLKLCDLKEDSQMGYHQVSQIFVNAIYHFLLGDLSVDDLSSIGNYFWAEMDDKATELANALYAASEMGYYIRRIYDKNGKHGGFDSYMIQVMEFYEKHREVVVKED